MNVCIVSLKKVLKHRTLPPDQGLLLLVSVLSQTLLTLVRCHFVLLSFLTAWHSSVFVFSPLVPHARNARH